MPTLGLLDRRDPRVDLLRGLSLLSIFVDHIPRNRLADYTLHNLGFSDAAELFVILSGFSAAVAYGRVFSRGGIRVGLGKVAARCLRIYGLQVILLLATLVIAGAWTRHFGQDMVILAPIIRDGVRGVLRGVALGALPQYLDILPLYILLLGAFPLVQSGLAKSVMATLAASFALYAAANVLHWDLPNGVDPLVRAQWYFNPFTWQLVFVCGAAIGTWTRAGAAIMTRPPPVLRAGAWVYLVFAFAAVDAWHLWPAPLGHDFPGVTFPFALFGNEPKSYVTPWRMLHVLALVYVVLTSRMALATSGSRLAYPIVACGRHSLEVFAVGCLLALIGRLIFRTADVTLPTEILVNGIGFAAMIACGMMLDRRGKRAPGQAGRFMAGSHDAQDAGRRAGPAWAWRLAGRWLVGLAFAAAMPAFAASPSETQMTVPPAASAAATASDAFRIVAFGSSSTEGVGVSKPGFAYPAQLERLMNDPARRGPVVSVVNRGIGGEDIDDMLKRLQGDILARKPDLVIWQVGSNDPLRAVPFDRFERELRGGIAAMRRQGVEVILLEPQWCPTLEAAPAAKEIRAIVRQVGADEKIDVVRRYDLMKDWVDRGLVTKASLVGADGLHMTDRGYTLLARAVLDEIVSTSSAYRRKTSFARASVELKPRSERP